jgi:hypothetical protein
MNHAPKSVTVSIFVAAVARLLDEALTNEDGEDEMMWLGPEPPAFGIMRPPA